MSQADQDKSEKPTPYRLEEARKRGEVAKSTDVTGALVMVVFACIAVLTVGNVAGALATATRRMIGMAAQAPLPGSGLAAWTLHLYAPVGQAVAPLVLGLVVAGVLGNVLQTGPIFSTHPLKPDFKRMHPGQALKRIFSFRSVWELGKLCIKMGLLLAVALVFLAQARALSETVALVMPRRLGTTLLSAFSHASLYVLAVLVLVAVLDLLFTRREYTRKMRMSRRELKDEVKRRDGDPGVKSRQKQQIRELLKKTQALGRVREADMVVTNPTHVAVALRYRPGETLAPVVLAKGAGLLSGRIRVLARRHGVPLLPSPPLARALYRDCEIGAMVPLDHYGALAPLYRTVWAKGLEART